MMVIAIDPGAVVPVEHLIGYERKIRSRKKDGDGKQTKQDDQRRR
jgi:hypothetical protein